jgi:hypothetical protein
MEPYKITCPGRAYDAPSIGRRLAEKLDTHRWHILRIAFVNDQQPETYDAVLTANTVTPNAMKKLLSKSWCARQIMWPNRLNGILVEGGGHGYYLAIPGSVKV